MTTKSTIGALVTAITCGTINTSKAEEPAVHGIVETVGAYSTNGELVGTVDAIAKISAGEHLMFFARYRGTEEWDASGFSYSEFSVQNIRFPDIAYCLGIVLERQHADNWTDHRIGVQHAWQMGSWNTYALITVGETFAEGVALARYQREIGDMIFFGQIEAVGDVSYKGELFFATERVRLGVQKDVYRIALATDLVQTKEEAHATVGLAGAVSF